MSWKHEQPVEELIEEDSAGSPPAPIQADPSGNGRYGATPPARILGPPPSVQAHQPQDSSVIDTSLNRWSTNIEETGLVASGTESPSHLQGRRSTTRQTAQPKGRRHIRKDGNIQSNTSTSLAPMHSSKVSKAAIQKKETWTPESERCQRRGLGYFTIGTPNRMLPDHPARLPACHREEAKRRLEEVESNMAKDSNAIAPAKTPKT